MANASTYLSKTFSSAGNRKTMTFSFWIKRGSSNELVSGVGIYSTSQLDQFAFDGDGTIYINGYNSGGTSQYNLVTNAKYNDFSAWYHVVIKYDTTQATSSDRIKLYVNGTQVTSFSTETYMSQNYDMAFNNNVLHRIGNRESQPNTVNVSGSLAHFHFIDGTAYDASTFGETDSTSGVWKPKTAPSVTYGTNGYFLKFANASDLGEDSSGNNNDFTMSGSGTQTLDTPSNNYATLNPVARNAGGFANVNFLYGNTTMDSNETGAGVYVTCKSTLGMTKGKWYFEAKYTVIDNTDPYGIGISDGNSTETYLGSSNSTGVGYGYDYDGTIRNNNGQTAYGNSYGLNDIIGTAVDLDNNKLYFSINGVWQNSADPSAGTGGFSIIDVTSTTTGVYHFAVGDRSSAGYGQCACNFGNGYFETTAISSPNSDGAGEGKFAYTVPTGYYALNTKNLKTYG